MAERIAPFLAFSLLCMAVLSLCACIIPNNQIRTMPFRTLIGSVVDNNGQAVKQATVTTDPPTSTLLTDELGRFLITSLAEGVYTVQVAKQGFAANAAVIAIRGLGPFHVDIQMMKRVSSTSMEQEKLLPQIHQKTKGEDTKEGWWPTK